LRALGAAGYRAVAPDQRGNSPWLRPVVGTENYRLDHAVDDVRAIADALSWHRFHLVGHDRGAAVAWIAAANYAHADRCIAAASRRARRSAAHGSRPAGGVALHGSVPTAQPDTRGRDP
jgi:pimeloyl-ACP methyl ester carboxylesterase